MPKPGPRVWEKSVILLLCISPQFAERLAWDSTFLQHRFASVESNPAHAVLLLQLGHVQHIKTGAICAGISGHLPQGCLQRGSLVPSLAPTCRVVQHFVPVVIWPREGGLLQLG